MAGAGLCLLASVLALGGAARATEAVTITTTTAPTASPRYAPRNVVAIWVEDASGGFVKTLLRYGGRRAANLRAWSAVARDAGTIADAPDVVTGATRTGHGPITVTWNNTDYTGAEVPAGNYTIRMELTDHNASSASGNNLASVAVHMDGLGTHEVMPSTGGFSNISLDYGEVASAACEQASGCLDGDGCCPADCVFEVDADCDFDTARDDATVPGGCGVATGRATGAGAGTLAALALAWLVARPLSRRRARAAR